MNFELEAWETPHAVLPSAARGYNAEIEVRWRGQKRALLLKSIRSRYFHCAFAREKDSGDIGNWLLAQRFHLTGLNVWSRSKIPALAVVASLVESGRVELARFSVVEEGTQTRRALTLPGGESSWLAANMEAQFPFDLPISDEDFYRDGSVVCEAIRRELARPDSDARFAANWLRWKQEKRRNHVFGVARVREIQSLMRAFLSSRPAPWQSSQRWVWLLTARGNQPCAPYTPIQITRLDEPETALFLEFARLLTAHFAIAPDHPEMRAHRCVRQFVESDPWPRLEMTTPPTAHQQLEARLQLRAWLQHNAPQRLDLLD